MRTGISVIVALLVLLGVLFTLPQIQYEPHGVLLPTTKANALVPQKDVKFLEALPAQYKTVGDIHIVSHFNPSAQLDTQAAEQQILAKAKQMAMQMGANAVVVRYFAHSDPNVQPNALAIYSFNAEAIFVEGLSHGV